MYIVVNHQIEDPSRFWDTAKSATANLPANVTLHHTFPSADGRRAVCVWEADSVEAVRSFLDPTTAGMARNEYFDTPNKEGISLPTMVRAAGA